MNQALLKRQLSQVGRLPERNRIPAGQVGKQGCCETTDNMAGQSRGQGSWCRGAVLAQCPESTVGTAVGASVRHAQLDSRFFFSLYLARCH